MRLLVLDDFARDAYLAMSVLTSLKSMHGQDFASFFFVHYYIPWLYVSCTLRLSLCTPYPTSGCGVGGLGGSGKKAWKPFGFAVRHLLKE